MFFSFSDKMAKWKPLAAVVLFTLPAAAAQAQEDSQWGSGQNLYDKVCALCHAAEVEVGPLLAGRGLPEAYIKFIVRNGFRAMPSFPASFIDDESITLLSEYLSVLPAPDAQP